MQRWVKYSLAAGEGAVVRRGLASSFEAQAAFMDGYGVDAAYADREAFFAAHLTGRYTVWDRFIRSNVPAGARVFSVASGRGINEMRLLADGFQVTCSDLKVPDCHEANVRLFGPHAYLALDIVRQAPPGGHDAALCLSLIYLFDAAALDACLGNLARALAPGGVLILDGAGSEPSLLGRLYHSGLLKWEAWVHYLLRRLASATPLSRFRYDLLAQDYGYRWKADEIIALAERHGLRMVAREEHDPETDLLRSPLLARVMRRPNSLAARLLVAALGRRLKYLRLFAFRKQEGASA